MQTGRGALRRVRGAVEREGFGQRERDRSALEMCDGGLSGETMGAARIAPGRLGKSLCALPIV